MWTFCIHSVKKCSKLVHQLFLPNYLGKGGGNYRPLLASNLTVNLATVPTHVSNVFVLCLSSAQAKPWTSAPNVIMVSCCSLLTAFPKPRDRTSFCWRQTDCTSEFQSGMLRMQTSYRDVTNAQTIHSVFKYYAGKHCQQNISSVTLFCRAGTQ